MRLELSARSVLADTVTNYPPMVMKPISAREFVVTEGESLNSRADFIGPDGEPAQRLRIGGRLADRIGEDAPPL